MQKCDKRGRKGRNAESRDKSCPRKSPAARKRWKVRWMAGGEGWLVADVDRTFLSRPFCCVMLNKSPENRTLDMDLGLGFRLMPTKDRPAAVAVFQLNSVGGRRQELNPDRNVLGNEYKQDPKRNAGRTCPRAMLQSSECGYIQAQARLRGSLVCGLPVQPSDTNI